MAPSQQKIDKSKVRNNGKTLMDSLLEGCTPAVLAHNQELLNSTQVSTTTLPPRFVLQKPDTNFAVLVETTQLPRNCWKLDLVRDPSNILHNYMPTPVDAYAQFEGTHTILVQRESRKSEFNKKLYKTQVWFANQGLTSQSGLFPSFIPVLKMSSPHTILASQFTRLLQVPGATHWRFPYEMYQRIPDGSIQSLRMEALEEAERAAADLLMHFAGRRPPTPPPTRSDKPAMPAHVVNVFVEAAIAKGELCPITQEALTKETTVVTPCGHALDNSSAKYWISTKNSCPVCRHPCSEDQLQKWTV
jgi:hypothetical protein